MSGTAPPPALVIHAGFHKTGTSSVQDFLRRNRDALAPQLSIALREDLAAAATTPVTYARVPLPWRRRAFSRAFERWLAARSIDRPLLVSWEGLSGLMPGHRRISGRMIRDYRAAVPLARTMARAAARTHPGLPVHFVYTLRDAEDWGTSVHGHILRSRRLRLDEATFTARLRPPGETVARLRRAVAPATLTCLDLETAGRDRLGPAGPLLALAGVGDEARAQLPDAQRTNRGDPPERRAAYLAHNRSLRGAALRRAKRALGGR